MAELEENSIKTNIKSISNNGKRSVSFLTRIANILVSLSNGVNTVTEISKECEYSLSTTHRLLQTLKKSGFVVRDERERHYYLGPLISELASNSQLNHRLLLMCSLEELSRLSYISQETIAMRIQIGLNSYQLYEIPSKQNISVNLDPPDIEPIIPEGPMNKVFLTHLSDRELRSVLNGYLVAAANKDNLPDLDTLINETKQVRQQGYAISQNERFPGITALAVPVMNYRLPAAISIVGIDSRIMEKVEELVRELKVSAGRISDNLLEYYNQESTSS